jgi:cytoskeletal protein CcmA (bactofilin family)
MALWKDQNAAKKEETDVQQPIAVNRTTEAPAPRASEEPRAAQSRAVRSTESVIAADLSIDGRIEGAGHVRLAGHFTGDVNVEGNLTIDSGAKLNGSVRARTVTVGGELEGNIESATRVDLLETGVLLGDLKAGALTVAAGSRMRGHVEFGWEAETQKSASPVVATSAAKPGQFAAAVKDGTTTP